MKLTGERPIAGKTPDSLLALHEAGYREVRARIGPGRFLDVGCGLGDASATFVAPGREVIGLDYDADTAREARRLRPELRTVCSDGARVGLRSGAFDWVCSSHLVEHFTDPERHIAEIARLLSATGSAFIITPNKPADFENPFHLYLFEPTDLTRMLGRHFADVEVLGLDGDAVVQADFEARRKWARRLLALDVLDLRHRVPRRWYVALHALARRMVYPVIALAGGRKAETPTITAERFSLKDTVAPSTLVLFAVVREPLAGSAV